MISTHLLDAAGRLDPATAEELRAVAGDAARDVGEDLGLDGVDLVICDYRGLALPGIGVGGYSPSDCLAFIAIEPGTPAFRDHWRSALPRTIAHELHHVRRWQGPGYGTTLRDSLVSEGLATLYEIQARGAAPPYAEAVTDSVRDDLWAQARTLLDRTDQHARWFFGGSDLPLWSGYTVGTELARRYCLARGTTARDAVDVAAEEFPLAW